MCTDAFHGRLLGHTAEMLISIQTMAELAEFIRGFGETNRKTVLARALATCSGSATEAAEAAEEMQKHGLCVPSRTEDADVWAQLGVRACAVALLRGGREAEALKLLKDHAATATSERAPWS